jgi:hypothetical protein
MMMKVGHAAFVLAPARYWIQVRTRDYHNQEDQGFEAFFFIQLLRKLNCRIQIVPKENED